MQTVTHITPRMNNFLVVFPKISSISSATSLGYGVRTSGLVSDVYPFFVSGACDEWCTLGVT